MEKLWLLFKEWAALNYVLMVTLFPFQKSVMFLTWLKIYIAYSVIFNVQIMAYTHPLMRVYIFYFLIFGPEKFWQLMTFMLMLHHVFQPVYNQRLICRNMSHFQDEVQLESNKVDNLLANLRRYYNNINSKRQLNLEVPAGFRKNNNFQRLIRDAHLYNLSHNAPDLFSDNHIEEHILSDDIPQVTTPHIDDSESISAFHADNDSNTRVLILIPSILVNSE